MEQDTVQDQLFDRVQAGSIDQLQFDPDNANRGTESGDYVLTKSIQRAGIGRGVVCDRNLTLLAGNKTTEKAGELDVVDDVVYVRATGNTLVVTVREDLDLNAPKDSSEYQKARELSVADNWASVKNTDLMAGALQRYRDSQVQVGEYISQQDWDRLISPQKDADTGKKKGEEGTTPTQPNDIFPSSNDWGIPDLDPNMQPTTTDVDWLKWGVQQRTATHDGGIHFYTDDYKFSAVWDKPDDLLETGCSVAVEPNFSTWANMPRALAMTDIYKKRWLARYWQQQGVRLWVDVNTSPHLHDLNFLGVPKEWRYFATRYLASFDDGNVAGYDATMSDWQAIVDYTGTEDCVLLVYGARPTTFKGAPSQWILQLEHSDFIRGNYSG